MPSFIETIFQEILQYDLLEDRREYCIEDLQSAYGLNIAEAQALYDLIQKEFK